MLRSDSEGVYAAACRHGGMSCKVCKAALSVLMFYVFYSSQ